MLLAGLRVVSVSTVSLVSVGALIGVSNLGSFFTDGYRRDFTTEIVVGVVGIVAAGARVRRAPGAGRTPADAVGVAHPTRGGRTA